MAQADWERRLETLWASIDDRDGDEFVAAMEDLVAELPPDDAVGPFEQASAFDSAGHPDLAVARYRQALDGELRSHAFTALAPHLPRYNRSPAAYARELA